MFLNKFKLKNSAILRVLFQKKQFKSFKFLCFGNKKMFFFKKTKHCNKNIKLIGNQNKTKQNKNKYIKKAITNK